MPVSRLLLSSMLMAGIETVSILEKHEKSLNTGGQTSKRCLYTNTGEERVSDVGRWGGHKEQEQQKHDIEAQEKLGLLCQ